MYADLLQKHCEDKRILLQEVLLNSLRNPDAAACSLMKGPGYTTIQGGEVLYVVKCKPVNVTLYPTSRCYQHLSVSYQDKQMFLNPKYKTLSQLGIESSCSQLYPSHFEIDGKWYKTTPSVTETLPPKQMDPNEETEWKYQFENQLGSSGLYDTKLLDKWSKSVIYGSTRAAIEENIVNMMSGQSFDNTKISVGYGITEDMIKEKLDSWYIKVWGVFGKIGSFFAGILGVVIVLKAIGLIVRTALNGYSLYQAFGFSFQLLGACANSITHFLINRSQETSPKHSSSEDHEEEVPLKDDKDGKVKSEGLASHPYLNLVSLNRMDLTIPSGDSH